jgi:hypothetical protein
MTTTNLAPQYSCIRCGYSTKQRSHMENHLMKKKRPCPAVKNLIELTIEIKQHILNNRIYIIRKPSITEKQLLMENALLKTRINENVYQMVVERYLGGGHKRLNSGITDVLKDVHAEIKEWSLFKYAVGQLVTYCAEDPKRKQIYLFGNASKKCISAAVDTMQILDTMLYSNIGCEGMKLPITND